MSYLLSLLVLVGLIVAERGQRAGRSAFPVMLAVTTLVYGLWFTWAQTDRFLMLVAWFRDLPLT